MSTATLHCNGELQDLLTPDGGDQPVIVRFDRPAPVRHLAELHGIPHTEIARVQRNGLDADLEDTVADGDSIELFPWPDGMDASPLREKPRFVTDAHLGKLADYLRLLGFDTLHHNDIGDAALAELSAREQRVLLSRDRALLMRRSIEHGCYLRQDDPWQQLEYLNRRLGLCDRVAPFSRCMRCNGLLAGVDKRTILDRVPVGVAEFQQAFWQCTSCGQVYWRGSHWRALADKVEVLCGPSVPSALP